MKSRFGPWAQTYRIQNWPRLVPAIGSERCSANSEFCTSEPDSRNKREDINETIGGSLPVWCQDAVSAASDGRSHFSGFVASGAAAGMNFRATELMQKRLPVGVWGASGKTCPRCDPQRAQVTTMSALAPT